MEELLRLRRGRISVSFALFFETRFGVTESILVSLSISKFKIKFLLTSAFLDSLKKDTTNIKPQLLISLPKMSK